MKLISKSSAISARPSIQWQRILVSYFKARKSKGDKPKRTMFSWWREPPPSPSASEDSPSSHHHNCRNSKDASKKPFFKLDVKFDLPMFNGEINVEKLDNWIRQIEVYRKIQQIMEDEAKVQLASL